MVKHRIRRGFPFLLGFEAKQVVSAVIGDTDIAGKYDEAKQAFDLRHADTEEIPAGILNIEYKIAGSQKKQSAQVKLEITNGR